MLKRRAGRKWRAAEIGTIQVGAAEVDTFEVSAGERGGNEGGGGEIDPEHLDGATERRPSTAEVGAWQAAFIERGA